jgi:hypothetical protein
MVNVIHQRRGQKHKQSNHEVTSAGSKLNATNNPEVATLIKKINRLDNAKTKLNFLKILLCIVATGRVYNIFTRASSRYWSGIGTAGLAFQNMNIQQKKHVVPKELLQPFGVYPNIFNITKEMRSQFHPVVKFPPRENQMHDDSTCVPDGRLNELYNYIVKDFTGKGGDNAITIEGKKLPQLLPTREEAEAHATAFPNPSKGYDVGRYDEDRRGMYTSSLFVENDAEDTRRTVHVGIDIGAPVNTDVYAFVDGIVHSVGYNSDVGDYGHVIVIEHSLAAADEKDQTAKLFALYGHLAKSVLENKVGDKIAKGQILGQVGNTDENGGWTGTHLHFQLSVNPPVTHDMPGTVRIVDRDIALLEYPDPRFVLGELY